MIFESVIIFGYNDFSKEIALQIENSYEYIHIFTLTKDENEKAIHDGFNSSIFDLSDDWDELVKIEDISKVLAYCSLQNDEQNTFLTISLNATFPELFIVALANDFESANKLKIAGASKVLSIVQTTSDMISDYLEKPTLNTVLQNILYKDSELKLSQVTINKDASLIGTELHQIDWKKHYNILILSVTNNRLDFKYIFTAKGHHHKIIAGDILVIIGYTKEIEKFKQEVNHCEINWSNRSW